MSSLKDWYRYVDSKARSRPEGTAPPEGDRSTGDGQEDRLPGDANGAPAVNESAAGESPGSVAPGEEELDVWSGLFPQPRKPEPKPTTAPLRRPTARLDEVPPDLPFTRTPIDGPPAPQFELPQAEAAIPRFDEFVSPFIAEPEPSAAATSPSSSEEPNLSPSNDASVGQSQPSIPDEQESAAPAAALDRGAAEPASAAASVPQGLADALEALESKELESDDAQVRWRSPFPLPGPGRTVSSGAPGPRPAPTVPRQIPSAASPEQQALVNDPKSDHPAPRPEPGTEQWERERVERLARTFRDTLRSLEQSLAGPRTPAAPSVAPEEAVVERSPVADIPDVAESYGEAPSPAPVSAATDRTAWAEEVAQAEKGPESEETDRVAPAGSPSAEDRPALPSLRRPVTSATPDVLRNIEEAALIRQRLPQHMSMLLRIPTNEVAQHSYKSAFRESREDLIGRLLDPQLTLEEAARILGVCPTTVRRYTNRGMLQCHRTPGNQRRFRMSDVLQFLEQYGDRIDRAAEAKQEEATA